MLKETQGKITPVEVPEWYQEAILKERIPWHARITLRTWIVLGGLGVVFLVVLFLALTSLNSGREQAALSAQADAVQATQPQQESRAVSGIPSAPDERMVQLSIATAPQGATVYLNEDSIGVTPLTSYSVKPDMWVLSIRGPTHAAFDTVLFLEEDVSLYLPLRVAEPFFEGLPTDDTNLPISGLSESVSPGEARQNPNPPVSDVAAPAQAEPEPEGTPRGAGEGPQPGSREIVVTSNPPGVMVWLDDQLMGTTPVVFSDLKPGMRHIRLQREGYAPYAAELDLGSMGGLHRNLTTLGQPITIEIKPQGTLYIDDEPHGSISEDDYVAYLPAGTHRIKAVHPDFGAWEKTVLVGSEDAQRVVFDFSVLDTGAAVSTDAEEVPGMQEQEAEAQRAADSLEAVAQRNEQQYQYVAGQADALFGQGNFEEALAKYEEMLRYKPGDPRALEQIAACQSVLEQRRAQQDLLDAMVEDGVYVVSDEAPELVGGLDRLHRKIRYPQRAADAGVQGRVYVAFIVNEKGRVQNPKIVQGLGYGCDEEVLRVIRTARFKPGKVDGRSVKVRHTLYVDFKIDE